MSDRRGVETGAVHGCAMWPDLKGSLARREDDSITPAESRTLKEHLEACRACREAAIAEDPTFIFLPLADSSDASGRVVPARGRKSTPVIDAEAERLVADVLAAVEVERSRRRLRRPALLTKRVLLRAASIAVLGGALAGLWKTRDTPVLGGKNGDAVAGLSDTSAIAVLPPLPDAAPASVRPVVEELKNPGAVVYEFASSSPQEPTVVFVVDRNADI